MRSSRAATSRKVPWVCPSFRAERGKSSYHALKRALGRSTHRRVGAVLTAKRRGASSAMIMASRSLSAASSRDAWSALRRRDANEVRSMPCPPCPSARAQRLGARSTRTQAAHTPLSVSVCDSSTNPGGSIGTMSPGQPSISYMHPQARQWK